MTMPTDVAKPPRQPYVENGVTTVHAISFKFIAAADISVVRTLVDGTEILLVQPTDYTVQGGGYDVGQITKATGGVAGATITIERNTPRDQLIDYSAGDDFSEESQEHALDKLAMIVQELHRDALRPETLAAALVSVLTAGVGIQIDATGATVTITSTVEGIGDLADFLMLSGDQQGGGSGDTSGASLDERIRDTMAIALQAGAGITITPNDVANSITIAVGAGVGGDNLTAEAVQDIVGALLAAGTGISVTYNDAGNIETITATGLDATYKGIVPTAHNANFDFADAMNGRSTNWTGGAGVATIRLEADVALSAGWVHRIRNTGTGNLSIQRATAGVSLFKNGAVVSADAILAPGGTVTLERWGANDFTITGTKLS